MNTPGAETEIGILVEAGGGGDNNKKDLHMYIMLDKKKKISEALQFSSHKGRMLRCARIASELLGSSHRLVCSFGLC